MRENGAHRVKIPLCPLLVSVDVHGLEEIPDLVEVNLIFPLDINSRHHLLQEGEHVVSTSLLDEEADSSHPGLALLRRVANEVQTFKSATVHDGKAEVFVHVLPPVSQPVGPVSDTELDDVADANAGLFPGLPARDPAHVQLLQVNEKLPLERSPIFGRDLTRIRVVERK